MLTRWNTNVSITTRNRLQINSPSHPNVLRFHRTYFSPHFDGSPCFTPASCPWNGWMKQWHGGERPIFPLASFVLKEPCLFHRHETKVVTIQMQSFSSDKADWRRKYIERHRMTLCTRHCCGSLGETGARSSNEPAHRLTSGRPSHQCKKSDWLSAKAWKSLQMKYLIY